LGKRAFDPRQASFAAAGESRAGELAIRIAENLSGRLAILLRLAGFEGFEAPAPWGALLTHLGGRIEIARGATENIPRRAGVIVVANHPYGLLDGLALGALMEARRETFRLIAFDALGAVPGLGASVLPVAFGGDGPARRRNAATRAAAVEWLRDGGLLGTFPAGAVSVAPTPWGRAVDPRWSARTACLAIETGATIVPMHFDGANGRLFQIASHVGNAARCALYFRELRRGLRRPLRVAIGRPIATSRGADPEELTLRMRSAVYGMSTRPADASRIGHDVIMVARNADAA
jgi:1-acyl-sn-glycerol-3-phosphate acyltransferase